MSQVTLEMDHVAKLVKAMNLLGEEAGIGAGICPNTLAGWEHCRFKQTSMEHISCIYHRITDSFTNDLPPELLEQQINIRMIHRVKHNKISTDGAISDKP